MCFIVVSVEVARGLGSRVSGGLLPPRTISSTQGFSAAGLQRLSLEFKATLGSFNAFEFKATVRRVCLSVQGQSPNLLCRRLSWTEEWPLGQSTSHDHPLYLVIYGYLFNAFLLSLVRSSIPLPRAIVTYGSYFTS